ncbi:hypothetical protein BYT27DRAFT_7209388 [Phlegmacium glaucopus]|nr:hypothetical protein BYT27DRAFT_7209388 [Phlegmacium glaucopus]
MPNATPHASSTTEFCHFWKGHGGGPIQFLVGWQCVISRRFKFTNSEITTVLPFYTYSGSLISSIRDSARYCESYLDFSPLNSFLISKEQPYSNFALKPNATSSREPGTIHVRPIHRFWSVWDPEEITEEEEGRGFSSACQKCHDCPGRAVDFLLMLIPPRLGLSSLKLGPIVKIVRQVTNIAGRTEENPSIVRISTRYHADCQETSSWVPGTFRM